MKLHVTGADPEGGGIRGFIAPQFLESENYIKKTHKLMERPN